MYQLNICEQPEQCDFVFRNHKFRKVFQFDRVFAFSSIFLLVFCLLFVSFEHFLGSAIYSGRLVDKPLVQQNTLLENQDRYSPFAKRTPILKFQHNIERFQSGFFRAKISDTFHEGNKIGLKI